MPRDTVFVSTEWLAERLDAPDIVVVDGSWYLPVHARALKGLDRVSTADPAAAERVRELIIAADRHRRMLGGAMRQNGIFAAAALHGLDHHLGRLAEDHANARVLAGVLMEQLGAGALPLYFASTLGLLAAYTFYRLRHVSDLVSGDAAHFVPMLRTTSLSRSALPEMRMAASGGRLSRRVGTISPLTMSSASSSDIGSLNASGAWYRPSATAARPSGSASATNRPGSRSTRWCSWNSSVGGRATRLSMPVPW